MDYAMNSSNPLGFRLRALKAIAGQEHILPELEGDLAALTNDDVKFPADSDVGPRTNKKFYPIRDEALKVLKKFKDAHSGNSSTRQLKREPVETAKPDDAVADARANRTTKLSTLPESNVAIVFIPFLGWIALIAVASSLLWMFLKLRRRS